MLISQMQSKLFPYVKDKTKVQDLKIDEESVCYISTRDYAEKISAIIGHHLQKAGIKNSNAVITDATAGVGGNTISFGQHFKSVIAIEIDKLRSEYLSNNIKVFKLDNITVINDDCTKILDKIDNHNVVFLDPPWGGRSYKDHSYLKLQISNASIELLCNDMLNKNIMKKVPELIILKLPTNYNIPYFYNVIKNKEVYFYDLKKMYVLAICTY
jgi:predicted RNA methylase